MDKSGSGWITFAWIVLIVAGVFAIIDGVVAISRSSFFQSYGAHYVYSSLKTWGWVELIMGIIAVLAGFGVVYNQQWGRWIGMLVAAISIIIQIFWIPIVPFWALTIILLDVLVIYGLAVYGGKQEAPSGSPGGTSPS